MKTVILDRCTVTKGDVDTSPLEAFGEVEYFDIISKSEIIRALQGADAVICNKAVIDKEIIDEDLLILNFNSALFDNNSTIKEEVLYTLSYSVFSNYDVNTISFKVDNKDIETVKRSSLA